MNDDPNRLVRYPLSWPAWLAEKVTEAARARAMSVAAWMREAAIKELERTKRDALLDQVWKGEISIDDARRRLGLTPFGIPETRDRMEKER